MSHFTQPRVLELRAWMAARRGDRQAERAALESKIALEPADSVAVERLADLAAQDGERERLAELRRRKAAIDAARLRYRGADPHPRPDDAHPRARPRRRGQRPVVRRQGMVGARGPPRSIPRSRGRRPRSLAWPRPSRRPSTAAGRWPTCLGRPGRAGTAKTAVPGTLSIPAFTDDAERRGLAFTFDNGHSDLYQLPETFGGGVAVLDFDGDGWLDIYAVQGGAFPPVAGPAALRRPPLPQPRRRSVR